MNAQVLDTDVEFIDEREPGLEPKRFVLYMMLVSSVMLFAGLTSAFIVRRGDGNWDVFELPSVFVLTTILIILSSVFMQLAYVFAKRDELGKVKISLAITFMLGILFIMGQFYGWSQMVSNSVYFAFDNPSGSFVYVITGVHLGHILVGLGYLAVIFIKTVQFKIHKKRLRGIAMCAIFWHFIGALWIYLFVFLSLNR